MTVGDYVTKGGLVYEKRGELKSALKCYLSALKMNPNHKFAVYRAGVIYYKLGDYKSAVRYLEKAIKLNPNQMDAYSYLWNSYGKLGDYKKALEIVNKALKINPNYKEAKTMKDKIIDVLNNSCLEKGLEYFKNKKYDDAISKFKEYLSIMPESGRCYYYLGECYFELKKYSDAILNYKRCINLCPNTYHNNILKKIGVCYFKLNDFKNAIQYLSSINNLDVESRYYLGLSYLNLGNEEKAESFFNSLISIIPPNLRGIIGNYCYDIGKRYYTLKKYDKALKYLNKSTELNPKAIGFWYLKGEVYYALGKYTDAKRCFNIVLEKDRNNVGAINYINKINNELYKINYSKTENTYNKSNNNKYNYKPCSKTSETIVKSVKNNNISNTKPFKKTPLSGYSNKHGQNVEKSVKNAHFIKLHKNEDYEFIINKKLGNSIINTIKMYLSKIGLADKHYTEIIDLEKKIKEYYDKGDLNSIINTYESIIKLVPNNDEMYKLYKAKYNYFVGIYSLINKQYIDALRNIETATKIFSELNLIDCMLISIKSQIIVMRHLDESKIPDYIEKIRLQYKLDSIQNIKKYEPYYSIGIEYYKYKSKLYRKSREFYLASVYSEEERKLAEEAYNKFKKDYFKQAMLSATKLYWNNLAKYNESLKLYVNAYECYIKAGDIAKEMGYTKEAYEEYTKAYKCLALAHFRDKNKFIEYVDKAIEYAKMSKDSDVINYIYGFKYETLAANIHSDSLEESIDNLKKAYEYYKKSSDDYSSAVVKVKYHYLNAKLKWAKQKYEEALNEINKALQLYKESSIKKQLLLKRILSDKPLYEFYVMVKNGDIYNSVNKLQEYLNTFTEKGKESKKYKFFNILYKGIKLLMEDNYSYETISKIDELKKEAKENNLYNLYRILNTISSNIILRLDGIKDSIIEKQQMYVIISRIIKDEVSSTSLSSPDLIYSRDDVDVYDDIGESCEYYDYLNNLPPMFIGKLKKYEAEIKELKKHKNMSNLVSLIIKEYYTILEEYLKIVVEFNAKVLWGNNWKNNLKSSKYKNGNISKMSLQDLINSLRILMKKNSPYIKNLQTDFKTLLDVLEEQKDIRNDVSHRSVAEKILNEHIKEKIIYIFYSLSNAFPDCIKVMDKVNGGYKCILCKGEYAKSIIVRTSKQLVIGNYYYTKIDNNDLKNGILDNPKYLYKMEYNTSEPLEKSDVN